MADFPLTPAQRSAVEHRGGPLLIAAGAGSGKTRVLVERLLDRILRDGLDVDRFLLITYTRSAAAELRSRIQEALSRAAAGDPGRRQLRRQLALVNQASIGTIHSFCASILRENAALLSLRPDFRQMDDAEQAVVRGEVLDALLEDRYARMTPEFRLLADTLDSGADDSALKRVVLQTHDAVQSHPYPEDWLRAQWEAPVPEGDAADTPWGALLLESARRQCTFWLRQFRSARERLAAEPRLESAYAPALEGTAASLRGFLEALDSGWDAACAFGPVDFPRLGGVKGLGDHPLALEIKALRDRCKARMKQAADLFDTDSAGHREDFLAMRPVTDALFRLTADFSQAYSEEKRRRNAMDYADLEHLSLRLLTDREGNPTRTAADISGRFEEILVDEYQDCNRVQELIFRAVSRQGRNITMVGDVKQSIYRFRLADPGLFLEKYAAYADEPGPGQGRRVLLRENFRSDAGILRGVNQAFSLLFSRELGELEYGEAESLLPGAGAPDVPGSFELRLLETRESGPEPEAEAVALRIQQLLNAGIRVKEGAGDRPLVPGDVAILLRSARGRDRFYASALTHRGIPCVCRKTGDSFTERREVLWALSLLQIIDNPRQDIPLIAALRSPVWGFTADQLAALRSGHREGCLYEALLARGETDPLCAGVLRELAEFRLLAADLPADRLLTELYARTGLPAAAEAREKGASLWLEELVRCARDLGRIGCRGLYRFVQRLREAEEKQVNAVSTLSVTGGGVTITTIHDSKGLEYPVVILADLARPFHRVEDGSPILIHSRLGAGLIRPDRERGVRYRTLPRLAVAEQLRREALSEELRVLYVAMTRARQKLLVFLRCRDRVSELTKLGLWAEQPVEPQALADCAAMGDWLTIAALARGQEGPWALLEAELPQTREEMPQDAVREETPADTSALEAELREILAWKYPYGADTRLPSKLTATALRETARQAEAAEAAEELGTATGTPSSGAARHLPPGEGTRAAGTWVKGQGNDLQDRVVVSSLPSPGGRWQTPFPARRLTDEGDERQADDVRRASPPSLRLPAFMTETRSLTPAEKGTALHLAMQYAVPENCRDPECAAAEVERLREQRFLRPEQAAAVDPKKLSDWYASPLGKRVLTARGVHREFKFSLLAPAALLDPAGRGEMLLQGVVDCWLEEPDGLIIIDYKTDRVTRETQEARAAEYAPQLGAYAWALERITGKPAKAAYVYFFTTGTAVRLAPGGFGKE